MKRYPLLILIITGVLLVSLTGFLGKDTVYARYADDPVTTPFVTLPFIALTDGVYPWSAEKEEEDTLPKLSFLPDADNPTDDKPSEATDDKGVSSDDEPMEAQGTNDPENDDGITESVDVTVTDGNGEIIEEEPGDEEPVKEGTGETLIDVFPEDDTVYSFTTVDDTYFADAVFIGDSRTVGLMEYCKPIAEQATFYAKTSLTIYNCMTDPFLRDGDRRITVDEALQMRQFKKVYLMLGLNEMGTGDDASFIEYYYRVVARIMELQPDAIIYVEGLMHVTANKSARDKIFNNERINNRNTVLAMLADNKRIFYINMNEATDDENGNLTAELSFDGVHLYARAYERWHEFLLNHAIVKP